jgi:hypothetical protein
VVQKSDASGHIGSALAVNIYVQIDAGLWHDCEPDAHLKKS